MLFCKQQGGWRGQGVERKFPQSMKNFAWPYNARRLQALFSLLRVRIIKKAFIFQLPLDWKERSTKPFCVTHTFRRSCELLRIPLVIARARSNKKTIFAFSGAIVRMPKMTTEKPNFFALSDISLNQAMWTQFCTLSSLFSLQESDHWEIDSPLHSLSYCNTFWNGIMFVARDNMQLSKMS